MFVNIINLVIFVFSINVCVSKKYSNYTLYRAIPVNESHVEYLSDLDAFYDIDFWRAPGQVNKPVELVINPSDQLSFRLEVEKQGIYLTTIIDDVQKAFDQQTVKAYIRRQMDSFDWNNYYRLDDIYQWLTDLSKKYPNVLSTKSIGTSEEGREIWAVKIILKGNKNRPKAIVEGGIHAREWISPAVVTYLINEIIHSDSSDNEALKNIAKYYEWHIVPVLNVDGYEYTHTTDRLWRKNRNGFGVDLNRNFAHAFGTIGISKIKTSNLYCGENAFSEKESTAMAKFVKENSENLAYYLSFHSYGLYMILPYASSNEHLENFDEVYDMCESADEKLSKRYGTRYDIGTALGTIGYGTSGGSACWVKETFKVPYVLTMELRDTGRFGFALPPSEILPTCLETMDGIIDFFTPRRTRLSKNVNSGHQSHGIGEPVVVFFNTLLFIIARD